MTKNLKNILKYSIYTFLIISSIISAQNTGTIIGIISDESSSEPLVGANIMISGTVLGSATDIDGKYRINNVPIGKQALKCSYLGYKSKTIPINIIANKAIEINVSLESDVILSEDVIVTAMLEGQQRAINQQLSSNTIVNIVSKDKIEELPDQNAAETLGRLPGISVQRDAGEGQKIVIRGLAPKFNSIMINGESIPSTDPVDRSVDLSMISSDILEGIEVYKALTPDQDADAIGGVVNFTLKKAPVGFKSNLTLQTGYNSHESEYGQYKGNASISNRFFEDRLGVIISGNYQKANRSSDVFDAAYIPEGEDKILTKSINLSDRIETRNRYGANLALDYDLGNGDIVFNSTISRTDRDEIRRRKRYRVDARYVEYRMRDREINTTLFSNSLSSKYDLGFLQTKFKVSYSKSNMDNPFSHTTNFRELGAYNSELIEDKGPNLIPLGARNSLDETFFQGAWYDKEFVEDENFSAKADFSIPFSIIDNIGGVIKFGGKYKNKSRERDRTQNITQYGVIDEIGKSNSGEFDLDREGRIKLSNFIDPNFDTGDYLNGEYEFGPSLDVSKLNSFGERFNSSYTLNSAIDLEDYSASEKISAGYLMAEFNLGQNVLIIPGFRYEHTKNEYNSITGTPQIADEQSSGLANKSDTTGSRDYGEFLPMFHVKYTPTDWFDIRLAYTEALTRPNYFNLVYWERFTHGESKIERGNPDLKHTQVKNYDIFLSFYNRYGLLSLGGFYKNLENIDYLRNSRIVDPESKYTGYTLIQPFSSEYETTVYGFEVELQTNLMFLPSPFDGVVLYINYSKIHSETFFPLFKIGPRSTEPPYAPTVIDTVRAGKMPGQPDNILNVSIGYEKGGFSGRLSFAYQGNNLSSVGTKESVAGYIDSYYRWDLSLKQDIMEGVGVYFNVNNLSDTPDKSFIGYENFATHKEFFGLTADLGIRVKIK